MQSATTFRCIRCLAVFPLRARSEEHIFPDAIGGSLTCNDLCKTCNDSWGRSADVYLTDHALTCIRRIEMNITGKKGAIRNPFGVGTLVKDPDQIVWTGIGEPPGTPKRPFFQRRKQKSADGMRVTFTGDAQDREAILKAAEIFRIRQEKRGLTVRPSPIRVQKHEYPEAQVKLEFDLFRWRAGAAKIAYELAYLVAGASVLDDPIAGDLRRRLLQPEPSGDQFDGMTGEFRMLGLEPMPLPKGWHYGCVGRSNQGLVCHVRVFDLFECRIVVGAGTGLNVGGGDVIFLDARRRKSYRGSESECVPQQFEADLAAETAKIDPATD